MEIRDAKFAGSYTDLSGKQERRLPEFAFIGRSNVGKSSLINMLCGRNNLAKTSSTPGKTKLINRFMVNDSWYLVDLPGYGYAQMSEKDRAGLRAMINEYVCESRDMVLLFVLLDSRHDLQKSDLEFMLFLGRSEIPFSIIFTKGDKLGPVALQTRCEKTMQALKSYWEELPPCFISSSVKQTGRKEILDYVEHILNTIDFQINP